MRAEAVSILNGLFFVISSSINDASIRFRYSRFYYGHSDSDCQSRATRTLRRNVAIASVPIARISRIQFRHSCFVILRLSVNGAEGISDIEGKVARVAMSDLGKSEFQIRVIRLPRRSLATADEAGWFPVRTPSITNARIAHRTSSSTSRRYSYGLRDYTEPA
jgi:hypothetical protein